MSRAGAPEPGDCVWITRTRPAAADTARRVAGLGHTPLVAPLLRTLLLRPVIDLTGVGALAFTSLNGVEAFAGLNPERSLPVFAVGDATADAARRAGFGPVISAAGDIEALIEVIAAAAPLAGQLLWVGAEQPAGDLIGALSARGVSARGVATYQAEPVVQPEAVAQALSGAALTILIHSPRAARVLVEQALAATDQTAPRLDLPALTVLCISDNAARALAPLRPGRIAVADHPDEDALLALLGKPRERV